MLVQLNGHFLPTTIKGHMVKIIITWSISPYENNNIGMVYYLHTSAAFNNRLASITGMGVKINLFYARMGVIISLFYAAVFNFTLTYVEILLSYDRSMHLFY